MRNYIQAELYRAINRPLMWSIIIVVTILGWGGIGLSAYNNSHNNIQIQFEVLMKIGISTLTVVGFLVVIYIESVLSEDLHIQAAKNVLISGLSRQKFYLAKLVVESILGVITLGVISGAIIGVAWFVLPKGEGATTVVIMTAKILVTLVPLCIGCIGYGNFLGLFIKNTTGIAFIYPLSLSFANILFMVLEKFVNEGFGVVSEWMLYTQLTRICDINVSNQMLIFAALVGIVNFIVWAIIGTVVVKKQEIK